MSAERSVDARATAAAAADRLLFEHGHLDPFDCLIALGHLGARDHEDWRHQRRADLQSALRSDVDTVVAALNRARAYVAGQGFTPEVHPPRAWAAGTAELRVGSSPELTRLCGERLVRSTARTQTDLFQDSARPVALHALRTALAEHRFEDARAALRRFIEIAGEETDAGEYRQLIDVAESGRASAAERLEILRDRIAPMADRLLGARARDYLVPLWTDFADQLTDVPFDPNAPDLHASCALFHAGNWTRLIESVEGDARILDHEVPLLRLAEAYARQSRSGAARRVWSRLCWEHPRCAERHLRNAPADPAVGRLWLEFTDTDADLTTADFPAWLLIADERQRDNVPPELAPASQLGRVYAVVHRLVTTGGDIDARQELQRSHPQLLRTYLDRRGGVSGPQARA